LTESIGSPILSNDLELRLNPFAMLEEITKNPDLAKYMVSFKKGDILFLEGDDSQDLYVLVFGQVDILKGNKKLSEIPYDSRQTSNFVLEGSLDEFFESDSENFWDAVLTFSVTLTAENEPDISKRVLFQRTYHTKKPCKMKNPRALAEGMSEAMAELSRQMIIDIHGVLKN